MADFHQSLLQGKPRQEKQAHERGAEYTVQIFAATRSRVKASEPRLIVEQKRTNYFPTAPGVVGLIAQALEIGSYAIDCWYRDNC